MGTKLKEIYSGYHRCHAYLAAYGRNHGNSIWSSHSRYEAGENLCFGAFCAGYCLASLIVLLVLDVPKRSSKVISAQKLKINKWIETEYNSANVIYVDLEQNDSAGE